MPTLLGVGEAASGTGDCEGGERTPDTAFILGKAGREALGAGIEEDTIGDSGNEYGAEMLRAMVDTDNGKVSFDGAGSTAGRAVEEARPCWIGVT